MPPLTKATVGKYNSQMYGNFGNFLGGLPALISKDLDSGTYAAQ